MDEYTARLMKQRKEATMKRGMLLILALCCPLLILSGIVGRAQHLLTPQLPPVTPSSTTASDVVAPDLSDGVIMVAGDTAAIIAMPSAIPKPAAQ